MSKQMHKVLLVNSPISINNPKTAFIPLPLLILGNCLRKIRTEGLELDYELIDLDLMLKQGYFEDCMKFYAQSAEIIAKKLPDICLFTVHGFNLAIIIQIVKSVKAKRPDCIIVLGGVGATLQASDIMKHFFQIDVIVKGDGEIAIPNLIRSVFSDRDFTKVSSIVFRNEDGIVENARLYITSGDDFLSPDYTLVKIEEYVEHNKKHPYIVPGFVLIESGRGCSYCCSFCSPAKMWERKVRYRPIPEIISEMQFLASKGLNFSFFTQDNLDEEFLRKLCKSLIEDEVGIQWGCYARLDRLQRDIAPLLAEAGCRLIFVGLETSNRSMQKSIKKVMNSDQTFEKLKYFNSQGIKLICSFIAGFTHETEDELDETLRFAIECGASEDIFQQQRRIKQVSPKELSPKATNFCMVHPLTHMPGTDHYEQIKQQLRLIDFTLHHDSYGSKILGLDNFIRQNWKVVFNP